MSVRSFRSNGLRSDIDIRDDAWPDGASLLAEDKQNSVFRGRFDTNSINAWSKGAASEVDVAIYDFIKPNNEPPAGQDQQKTDVKRASSKPVSSIHEANEARQFRYNVYPHVYEKAPEGQGHSTRHKTNQSRRTKHIPDNVTRAIQNTARRNYKARQNIVPQIRLRDGTIIRTSQPPESDDDRNAWKSQLTSVRVQQIPLYIVRPKNGKPYVPDLLRPSTTSKPARVVGVKKANEGKKRIQPEGPVYITRSLKALPPVNEDSEDIWGQPEDNGEEQKDSDNNWLDNTDCDGFVDVLGTTSKPEMSSKPISKAPTNKVTSKKVSKKERQAAAEETKGTSLETGEVSDSGDPFQLAVTTLENEEDPFADASEDNPFIGSGENNPFADAGFEAEENPKEKPLETPEGALGERPQPIDLTHPTPASGVQPPYTSGALLPDMLGPPFANQPSLSHPQMPSTPSAFNPYDLYAPSNTYAGPPPGVSFHDQVSTQPHHTARPSSRAGSGTGHTTHVSEVKARATPTHVYVPRNPYGLRGGRTHVSNKGKKRDEHLNDTWGGIPVSVAKWKWPDAWRKG